MVRFNAGRSRTGRRLYVLMVVGAAVGAVFIITHLNFGTVQASGQQRSFEALGLMPGSCIECDTYATGLSADGSTVIGEGVVCSDGTTTCVSNGGSAGKLEAYRWTVANGYQLLGDLNGSFGSSPAAYGSSANAVSADGSVVVGQSPQGTNPWGAFLWTAAQGMQPLPMPFPQNAQAVNGNGTMIVGFNGWLNTSSGQSGTFGIFPGQGDTVTAFGVSGDGQIVVGFGFNGSNAFGPTNNPFTWTLAGGLVDIGTPGVDAEAFAISADGTVIVGEYQTFPNGPYHAFRWTASTGMVDIGTLGGPGSSAFAVNQDGSVIVGGSLTSQLSDSSHAFRWTAQTGMQDLNSLVSQSLLLTSANGVSADGTVIAGTGLAKLDVSTKLKKFRSQSEPFRAVVPLP